MENYLNRRAVAARPAASVVAIRAILEIARGQSAAAIESSLTSRISRFVIGRAQVGRGAAKRRPAAVPAWEPIGRLSAPITKRPAVGRPLPAAR